LEAQLSPYIVILVDEEDEQIGDQHMRARCVDGAELLNVSLQ
jgi:hypothetical protein